MSSLPGKTSPLYQTLQIELTNRCNLSCQTCIRAINGLQIHEQDLSQAVLQQLQPALSQTKLVHLQGWGETMLLDNVSEHILWFQTQGCKVSFTTNGSLMSTSQAQQLVSCGLDSITFSMAGASAATQDGLRGRGTHAKLWHSLHLLQQTKKEQGSKTPTLAISYLLTPETMLELPQAIKQCRSLGLTLFACVHLTHAVTREQRNMRVYDHTQNKQYKKIIRQAYWQAFWGGMGLQLPPFQPVLRPVCDKNPLSSCFIAANGAVAPCVFLYPPSTNHTQPASQISFGSLDKNSLEDIWQKASYYTFRKPFRLRQEQYEQEMAKVGLGLDGMEQLERANQRIKQTFSDIPVPECCHHCVKMKGF